MQAVRKWPFNREENVSCMYVKRRPSVVERVWRSHKLSVQMCAGERALVLTISVGVLLLLLLGISPSRLYQIMLAKAKTQKKNKELFHAIGIRREPVTYI